MNIDNSLWAIKYLPFVFGVAPIPRNGGNLPDALSFDLSINPRSGLLIQVPKAEIKLALDAAYKSGSIMCSNFDEEGIGRRYADDFLNFIIRMTPNSLDGANVLEIGCGGGYLLKCLKNLGANVLGVEPGDHGQIGAKKYAVDIIQDYFPTSEISKKFSVIVLSSVLEHVEEPIELLTTLSEYLDDGGKILISVPNTTSYINLGDVSPFFHEHWSYFDLETLKNTIQLAGYEVNNSEESGFGGSLYAAFSKNNSISAVFQSADELDKAIVLAKHFIKSAKANCESLRKYCNEITSSGKTLGIYVPFRFVNFFVMSGLSSNGIRFFDDDPNVHKKYYPGINIPIENRAELIARPTDVVLIMSHTFGVKLAKDLKDILINTSIATITDIF